METCRANGGGAVGAAIVNPPSEWRPNQNNGNHLQNFRIQAPIQQAYEKVADGCFTVCNTKTRNSVMFKNFTNTLGNYIGNNEPIFESNIDNKYWSMLGPLALFGADQNTCTEPYLRRTKNFGIFRKIEGNVIECLSERIEGLHSPFLYFGSWGTSFPWHTEDYDLYSLNYNHFGAPKIWYIVSESFADKFEQLIV